MVHFLSLLASNDESSMDNCVPKGVHRDCRRNLNWAAVNREKKAPAAPPVNEDLVRTVFHRFDANKDGRLSKQELKNAFASLGSRLPGVRAFLALRHADANGDGYISEAEFEDLVKYTLKRGYTFQ